jgi:hypothetical protein
MRYQAALRPDWRKPLQNRRFNGKGGIGENQTKGEIAFNKPRLAGHRAKKGFYQIRVG